MKTCRSHRAALVLAVSALLPALQLLAADLPTNLVALAASDFELNTDGWVGTNSDGGSETILYLSGGATSNSLGHINLTESSQDNATSFFVAPAKFLGDQRAAYNGWLTFNLRQNKTANLDHNRLAILGSGSNYLTFELTSVGTNWQSYALPLNENSGWHLTVATNFPDASNPLATRDDFLRVLGALEILMVRGEFSGNNNDAGDLDDVVLLGQPSGPTNAVVTAATYASIWLSGAVGSVYRVEYRDVLDQSTNWLALTNVVISASPYLFVDTNSPTLPQRFYRAALLP
jgi:Laminin B (Domain IV)